MVNFLARGGVRGENPENTMHAYAAAVNQGYTYVELTARVTKDLICVPLEDTTINRTAKHWTGSIVGAALPVAWLDYQQLLNYDFGVGFHVKFKDTRLPMLDEVLLLGRNNGIKVKLTSACRKLRKSHLDALLSLLDDFGDVAELTVNTLEDLQEAGKRYPGMHLHWDGETNPDTLEQIAKTVSKDNITFWLQELNAQQIAAVKVFGSVGVGELTRVAELRKAEALGVDIIATNGALKPQQNQGILSDMHIHTDHSHDAHYPMEEMLLSGIANGVKVIAVADHCDVTRCENDPDWDIYTNIQEACAEVDALNEKYGDQCLLLRGVELGDGIWYPEQSGRVATQLPYDVVVGSIHAIRCEAAEAIPLKEKWYSQIKFLDITEDQYQEFMSIYWADVLTMVETQNIDIMAHLLCASCYYGYRYGIWKDMHPYERQITKILETIIAKGIAFEASRQFFLERNGEMPYYWVVEKYYELGGYLITLGTDAHSPDAVGEGLAERTQILKNTGFAHIYYYKDRKAVPCSL